MQNVLYVLDDDPQYCKLLGDIAISLGWRTKLFGQANDFLETPSDEGILVLDLILPDMDGIEVIRELAQKKSKLKLILISGFDDKVLHSAKMLAEAHSLPVLSCFTKPTPIPDFIGILRKANTETQINDDNHQIREITKQDINEGFKKDQFVLHYQPQLNLRSGKIVGFEALIRWQHPELGLLYPNAFIELAEQEDTVEALTHWVLQTALRQLEEWQQKGLDWSMSVNIAASNLVSLNLPEQLEDMQQQFKIDSSHLMLELTESSATGSMTTALDILNRLRLKGYMLSIDDFGTGYSSLSKLYEAPFNELKIDRRFVSRVHNDNQALAITRICAALGNMLNMKVVAEGVEDQRTIALLQELGCHIAQGYHVGKPAPMDINYQKYLDALDGSAL